jgi:hypothetical protein
MRNIYRLFWYLLDEHGQQILDGYSFHSTEGSVNLFKRDMEKWNRLRKPFERLGCGVKERRQVTTKFAVRLDRMDQVLQYGAYYKVNQPDPSSAVSASIGHRTLAEIFAEHRD